MHIGAFSRTKFLVQKNFELTGWSTDEGKNTPEASPEDFSEGFQRCEKLYSPNGLVIRGVIHIEQLNSEKWIS